MKSFKSCLLAGVAGLMVLMSSCLGNGSNIRGFAVVGVIGFSMDAGRNVLQTDGGDCYFQGIEDVKFSEGSCWLMNIQINYDEQTSNKFSIVTLESSPIPFDSNFNIIPLTDGEIVLEPNEKPIGGILPAGIAKNKLFLASAHKNNTNQLNTLRLYFDPAQEPEKVTVDNAECNVYTVYLRSICTNEGDSSSSKDEPKHTAFDLGYFGRDIKEKEKAKKMYSLGVRVRYIKSIKEDGTFELAETSNNDIFYTLTGYTGESTN